MPVQIVKGDKSGKNTKNNHNNKGNKTKNNHTDHKHNDLDHKTRVGKGNVPPAKLEDIVEDLFVNQINDNPDGTESVFTFALLELSSQQMENIEYPSGSTPLNIFIYQQSDTIDENGQAVDSGSFVAALFKKNGYIHAVYYGIENQQRFDIKVLEKMEEPITLSNNAQLSSFNYIEVYVDVDETTTILSLSNGNRANMQFAEDDKYFLLSLTEEGVVDSTIPKIKITGISKSLKDFEERGCH